MLPCPIKTDTGTAEAGGGHRRKLLTNALIYGNIQHRILAAGSIVSCPLVSISINSFGTAIKLLLVVPLFVSLNMGNRMSCYKHIMLSSKKGQ